MIKKKKLKSVAEYITFVEQEGFSNFIYRGQNEPFYAIQAGGFRPYLGGWESDKIYDMEYIQRSFYNKLLNKISSKQEEYFLAYCQHHGIPTNLVDISYSPLVGLYFACEGKEEKRFSLSETIPNHSLEELKKDKSIQKMFVHNYINQSEKSFSSEYALVYLIKKERLLYANKLIRDLNGKSLFESIITNDDILKKFHNLLKSYFVEVEITHLRNWVDNIIDQFLESNKFAEQINFDHSYDHLQTLKFDNIESDEITINDTLSKIEEIYFENEYIKIICSDLKNNFQGSASDSTYYADLYTVLLHTLLTLLKNMPHKMDVKLDFYLTYDPPEVFGRIASQKSLFIYQPYLYTNDGTFDYGELNLQVIQPDIIIEIDNYEKIIQDLSLLGINRGTIFGDTDNIAKSILIEDGKLLKSKR